MIIHLVHYFKPQAPNLPYSHHIAEEDLYMSSSSFTSSPEDLVRLAQAYLDEAILCKALEKRVLSTFPFSSLVLQLTPIHQRYTQPSPSPLRAHPAFLSPSLTELRSLAVVFNPAGTLVLWKKRIYYLQRVELTAATLQWRTCSQRWKLHGLCPAGHRGI
jgi:hypothetical protein